MIKKVKEFLSDCTWDDIFNICMWKIPAIVCVAIILIVSGKITIEKRWGELLTYPEEEYQALENEAISMVENQTFDTDYNCIIKNLNNRSDDVSFELKSENASIDVRITDYKENTREIKIKRYIESKGKNIFIVIVIEVIIVPFLIALWTSFTLVILLCIVRVIWFLFELIKNKVKK